MSNPPKLPTKVSSNAPIWRGCQGCSLTAIVDTPTIFGKWAYFCESCYYEFAPAGAAKLAVRLYDPAIH